MASAIKGSVFAALDPNFKKSKITMKKIDLSPVDEKGKIAFLLRHVFTPAECAALIKISEEYEYAPAMINIRDGEAVSMPNYRSGHRVMIDDSETANMLFERISKYLPIKFGWNGGKNWKLNRVNERLRFLRYGPSNAFKAHKDGSYAEKPGESETFITLQIYINEGFGGGETTFLPSRQSQASGNVKRIPIVPETGMILVFQHDITHEGSVVQSGTKYTVRTDVLYDLVGKEEKSKKMLNLFNLNK